MDMDKLESCLFALESLTAHANPINGEDPPRRNKAPNYFPLNIAPGGDTAATIGPKVMFKLTEYGIWVSSLFLALALLGSCICVIISWNQKHAYGFRC